MSILYKIDAITTVQKIHLDFLWNPLFLFVSLTVLCLLGLLFFGNKIPGNVQDRLFKLYNDFGHLHDTKSKDILAATSNETVSNSPDFMNLDFLPLVTHENVVEDIGSNLQKGKEEDAPANHENVSQLQVEFEAINQELEAQELEISSYPSVIDAITFDPNELNFLPIIVDNSWELGDSINTQDRYRYQLGLDHITLKSKIEDYPVVLELGPNPLENELDDNPTFDWPDYLSEFLDQKVCEPPNQIPASVQEINMASLYDQRVTYEEEGSEEFIEWPLKLDKNGELENLPTENTENTNIGFNDLANEHLLNGLLQTNFIEEATKDLNQLLDDLEEMGDEREIPLLMEFFEKENDQNIKDRIRGLIKRFANWEPKPKKSPTNSIEQIEIPEYNVVRELFDSCDLEAKIILLDSILDVMDENDINFLKTLLNHPEAIIQKKAKKGLESLKKRLGLTEVEKNQGVIGFRNSGFIDLSEADTTKP